MIPHLLHIFIYSCLVSVVCAFRCMQCSGKVFEGNIRLSRSPCCDPTPVICAPHQICLRAYVVSEHSKFFLSGCHTPEDGLVGCDQHVLPNNATVHRCACMDERCQNYFPGTCESTPRRARPRPPMTTEATTTLSATTTERPADFDLTEEISNHLRKTNTTPANASKFILFILCLSLSVLW